MGGRGVTSAWTAVTSFFTSIPEKIEGAFSGAASWLVNAGKDLVSGFVKAIESSPGIVENALVDLVPSSLRSAVSTVLGVIPGHAAGTPFAPPGWAWVGEKGPELMHFAGGEQVKSHADSLSMLSQMASAQSLAQLAVPAISAGTWLPGVGAPLQGGALQLQVSYAGTGNELIDAIVGGLRVDIQGATGGDVQAHLGQGPVRI